jgi:sulfite exporter TauE/SafE
MGLAILLRNVGTDWSTYVGAGAIVALLGGSVVWVAGSVRLFVGLGAFLIGVGALAIVVGLLWRIRLSEPMPPAPPDGPNP